MADLALYDVTVRGHVTQMKLTAEHAEELGATKVGEVKEAFPQPVPRPPWAVEVDDLGAELDDDDEDDQDEEPVKKAPPARNKARSAQNKA